MELLLEKIAKNTEPKTSFFIMVSDKSTHIRTRFNPLIQSDKTKKYEMGLVGLDTYYSFPNIDSTNKNFKYSPDNGSTWFNINISEGSYVFIHKWRYEEYYLLIVSESRYKIIQEPLKPIYLPITLNTISHMETRLEDQNGELINLRGEELSIRFHIRQA